MHRAPSVHRDAARGAQLHLSNAHGPSWDVAWRGDLIYLFDMSRGVEILRLAGGPSAFAKLPTVHEPARRSDPFAARPVSGLTPGSPVCPVFVVSGEG